jgi:N-carbamoylputrescine amidase
MELKKNLKISLIQMSMAENDLEKNLIKAEKMIDDAAREAPDLIILPEFFNSEYFAQYRDMKYVSYAEPEDGVTISRVRQKAMEHEISIIATIYEEKIPGTYFDTAFLIGRKGEIIGRYRKTHPAAVNSLEVLYFRNGVSFQIFQVDEWPVGVNICYDAAFPEATRSVVLAGAYLVVVPLGTPKHPIWDRLFATRAWENGVYVAACNRVGVEGEWTFGGSSQIVSPMGEVVVQADEKSETVLTAELNVEEVTRARSIYPMHRDRKPQIYGEVVRDPASD